LFSAGGYAARMSDDRDPLTPATADDVADALAFALRFSGRKRVHNADELCRRSSPSAWSSTWSDPASSS
jgi:hypothetical protein